MFLLTKLSTLIHVLVTWCICYVDQSAPYFPIEVSRTATGRIGRYYFPAGFLLVGYIFYYESFCCEPQWLRLTPAFGMALLAVVNDEMHWQLHMVGLCLMVGAVSMVVLYDGQMMQQILFMLANQMALISVFLKTFIVLDDPLSLESWTNLVTDGEARKGVFKKCMDINYRGEGTKDQIVVYKVTAICQWVALAMLINIY